MMLIQWFVGGLGTSLSCGQFALANLLASQEHLMTLISPRIRHIDRKRGEGLSFEKKRGMFRAFRSFLKERIEESSSPREKKDQICVDFSNETKYFFVFIIQKAHTLTSMMGTTSALRRSNEQQFSALLYYIFIIE